MVKKVKSYKAGFVPSDTNVSLTAHLLTFLQSKRTLDTRQ